MLLPLLWLMQSSLFLESSSSAVVMAEKIPSTELAIGEWMVSFSCATDTWETLLFPPKIISMIQSSPSRIERQQHRNSPASACWNQWKRKPHRWPQRHFGKLALYPNGTFCLVPVETQEQAAPATASAAAPPAAAAAVALASPASIQIQKTSETEDVNDPLSHKLWLRGTWSINTNPYCVTDRYYDSIRFTAYSRVLKQQIFHDTSDPWSNSSNQSSSRKNVDYPSITGKGSSATAAATTMGISDTSSTVNTVGKLCFSGHCRLSGHYSGNKMMSQFKVPFMKHHVKHHTGSPIVDHSILPGKLTRGIWVFTTQDGMEPTNNLPVCHQKVLYGSSNDHVPSRILQSTINRAHLLWQHLRQRYQRRAVVAATFQARPIWRPSFPSE
jgi:hypothetical protein